MIDLTPLDVRNKRGDFKKIMRGYDPQEVDIFLELVAERLETLVRETIQLRERTQTLQNQVDAQAGREQAVQNALVTAQELRAEMQTQAQREADHIVKEAEVEARRLLAEVEAEVRSRLSEVERRLDQGQHALDDLERRRARFLTEFRGLLEREMDAVSVEEGRMPMQDRVIDLDLGVPRGQAPEGTTDATLSDFTASPSADLSSEPSSLEVELMAGAEQAGSQAAAQEAERFDGVPNLEEVLTESGVGGTHPLPDGEIAPPPAPDDPGQKPLVLDENNDEQA
ncbi:MAG: DivIVA domain-containing protein [Gemmatimonadota bacterium]|nr:DivIVA domain-containing protein [Gemmatimonadota bacterium]MDE3004658.1 DivIVA domain-containing protein [Gemmatimonadota bacterium]MDE3014529.1 DivIVA domain-containing protein [Gemmatimonadota bacterium]